MRKMIFPLCLAGSLAFLSFVLAQEWKINTNASYVNFTARAITGKVHGKISGVQGEIKFSEDDPENSSFHTWVEPGTLDTDNHKRDKHVKSSDYMDVGVYPKIAFQSKKIWKDSTGYMVTGDLTIKDVTREVTFPFTFEDQGNTGIFKGSFTLNRLDYHIGEKTKMMGEIIDVEIVTQVQK